MKLLKCCICNDVPQTNLLLMKIRKMDGKKLLPNVP
jgi:hypothetical protein